MSTSTNLKCKECTFRFVWKHNFWTRQQSLKLGLEALQDPKYLSNVNSAIIDSSENTTLAHTFFGQIPRNDNKL